MCSKKQAKRIFATVFIPKFEMFMIFPEFSIGLFVKLLYFGAFCDEVYMILGNMVTSSSQFALKQGVLQTVQTKEIIAEIPQGVPWQWQNTYF